MENNHRYVENVLITAAALVILKQIMECVIDAIGRIQTIIKIIINKINPGYTPQELN